MNKLTNNGLEDNKNDNKNYFSVNVKNYGDKILNYYKLRKNTKKSNSFLKFNTEQNSIIDLNFFKSFSMLNLIENEKKNINKYVKSEVFNDIFLRNNGDYKLYNNNFENDLQNGDTFKVMNNFVFEKEVQKRHLFSLNSLKFFFRSLSFSEKITIINVLLIFILCCNLFFFGVFFKQSPITIFSYLIFYNLIDFFTAIFYKISEKLNFWDFQSLMFPFGKERIEILLNFSKNVFLIKISFGFLNVIMEQFLKFFFFNNTSIESKYREKLSMSHIVFSNKYCFFVYYSLIFASLLSIFNVFLSKKNMNSLSSQQKTIKYLSNDSIPDVKYLSLEKNHRSIKKSLKFFLRSLSNGLTTNTIRTLTFFYGILLLSLPIVFFVVPRHYDVFVNFTNTFLACFCINYGIKKLKYYTLMILCSYPYSKKKLKLLKKEIINEITWLKNFQNNYQVKKLFISKFHLNLFVVALIITTNHEITSQQLILKSELCQIISNKIRQHHLLDMNSNHDINIIFQQTQKPLVFITY